MTRSQLTMIGVAALFLVPLLAAVFLNSEWSDWQPSATKNAGRLLRPPPLLPSGPAELTLGSWRVLYLASRCGGQCEGQAESLQRIYRSTGRDMDKVNMMIVSAEPVAPAIRERSAEVAPDVAVVGDVGRNWLSRVSADLGSDADGHALIVDPRGYVALDYPGADPNAVRKDLDRLLTWSKE